ncbi:MAG: tyrosine-type recombinase/integrase [Gemmataceae bacterium]
MAHLVRQKYTSFVLDGKHVPKGTKGAKKVTQESAKWYGAGLPGQGKKRFPLATDKGVAQKMLTDLVVRLERGEAKMPDRKEISLSLAALATEFEEALRRKAKEPHVRDVMNHVNKVLAGCKLTTLGDLRAPGLPAKVEAFIWGLTKGKDAISEPTAAYTGKHIHQFTRWLCRKKKLLDTDPLAGIDLPSQASQQTRRAFTLDELNALMLAAESRPKSYRGLTGQARALLYLVASTTGLRSGELAQLVVADFDLEADIPAVRLKGDQTKNGEDAEQPLPLPVVVRLRPYLAGKPADARVWPGNWHKQRSAEMLRRDLAAAKVPATTREGEGTFHSLRHTYTSMLARSAPVKVTQELLRHSSPSLTIGRYAHTSLAEKAEAVAALPMPGANIEKGPFAGMTRAELEAKAEELLTAVMVMREVLTPFLTPRLTPNRGISGDGMGLIGTMKGKGRRKRA